MEASVWVRHLFAPQVAVFTSNGAEALVAKSNLSVQELLHSCSTLVLEPELTISDGINMRHGIKDWAVRFIDARRMLKSVENASKKPRAMRDEHLVKVASQSVSRHAPSHDHVGHDVTWEIGQSPPSPQGPSPWFSVYSACILEQTLSGSGPKHECFSDVITTLLIVSATELDPLGSAKKLYEMHTRDLVRSNKLSSLAFSDSSGTNSENLVNQSLAYPCSYLVMSESREDAKKAHDVLDTLKAAFGKDDCFLLSINSQESDRKPEDHDRDDGNDVAEVIMDGHLHRFNPLWLRMRDQDNETKEDVGIKDDKLSRDESAAITVSHPLAEAEDDDLDSWMTDQTKSKSKVDEPTIHLLPPTKSNIARYLTHEDLKATRNFVQELCRRHVTPLLQRQIRILHDLVQSRKSRSIFSGAAKRWFSTRSASGNTLNSVVYNRDAIEMINRRLADIYFIMQNYKAAYSIYHALKRDFQGDEAWNYYGGACEMSALALFMQETLSTSKKFPAQYFEEAINKYGNVCRMPEFAFRATLFDALCLNHNKMYNEGAASFIRLTSDTDDLRSALLLEQAAFCFLSSSSMERKYAFHIVLSGYRFAKANQRQHAARAYYKGLQVMDSKEWRLAESHILFSLAHLALLLKDYARSSRLFNQLIASYYTEYDNWNGNDLKTLRWPSEQQQLTHLREFFMVHQLRGKGSAKPPASLPLPKFEAQQCKLILKDNASEDNVEESAITLAKWIELERVIVERISGQEILFLTKTWQTIMHEKTDNKLRTQALANDIVKIIVPVINTFSTELTIDELRPIYEFTEPNSLQVFTNDEPKDEFNDKERKIDTEQRVETDTLSTSNVILRPKQTQCIALKLRPRKEGEVKVVGVKYRVGAQFKEQNNSEFRIYGKQYFHVRGLRLNATKAQKTSVVYSNDCRLQLLVRANLPKVLISMVDARDIQLGSGSVVSKILKFINLGNCDAVNIHIVHTSPGLLVFENHTADGKFGFPLVSESSLGSRLENGFVDNLQLEFLKVPIGHLSRGQSTELKVFMRGRQVEEAEKRSVELICYAEAADEDGKVDEKRKLFDRYSLTTLTLNLTTTPTLTMSVRWSNESEESYSRAVVSVRNALRFKLVVNEVYIVSPCFAIKKCFVVNEQQSISEGKIHALTQIASNSSSAFVLTLANEKEITLSNRLHFSACGSRMEAWPLHKHPYMTFIKPHMDQNSNIPSLSRTLVFAMWSCSDNNMCGVHVSDVNCEANNDKSKTILRLLADKEEVWHDFEETPLAHLSFILEIVNEEGKEVDLALTNLDEQNLDSNQYVIEGCTDQTLRLGPKEKRNLNYSLAVTKAGVFVCRSLAFKRPSVNERWQRLEITLTVRPLECN